MLINFCGVNFPTGLISSYQPEVTGVWSWNEMYRINSCKTVQASSRTTDPEFSIFTQPRGRLKNRPLKHPNPWSLWMLLCMAGSADQVKVRILRCGDYLGSTQWALNAITSVLYEMEAGRDLTPAEGKVMWPGGRRWGDVAKECWQPQGAWKKQRMNSSLGPPEEARPCGHTLILASWNWFLAFGLQNCERMIIC